MTSQGPRLKPDLYARYPALDRLVRSWSRRRIPVRVQMTATECGAACLAMVLSYYGRHIGVDEISANAGLGRDGISALSLLNLGRWYGLRGRVVQLDVDGLQSLGRGAILHWEFKHFVVFDGLCKDGADIIDPAVGRRRVTFAQLNQMFTGIAVLFEPAETFTKAVRGPRPVWGYLRATLRGSGQWPRLLASSLMLQLFALSLPLLTGIIVDRIIPRGDDRLLIVMMIGLAILVAFHLLTSIIRSEVMVHVRTHFDSRAMLGFVDHLIDLPYRFFQQRPAGDLLSRINAHDVIRDILTNGTVSSIIDGVFVLGYLVLLALVSPGMALLALAMALVQLLLVALTWSRQRELTGESLRAQASSESFLVEMLHGIETLKASGSETRAAERWSGLFVEQLNALIARNRLSGIVDALLSSVRVAGPLVLLCYGATRVLDGGLSLGVMLSALALGQSLLTPIASLVATASQLSLMGSYLDRIEDVLRTPVEQERALVQPAPPLSGRVTLRDVTFRYSSTSSDVIKNASVDIAPGQFVAIVGRSGSGKSTLSNLLLGLYSPAAGQILYDGIDMKHLEWRSVRQQLGIVPQRAFLFGDTIRANIAMANPALPIEQIEDASRVACIDQDIAAMPMRYNTPLLDGGASLSGGQRQRIALARALALRPAILLLDEATSALDSITERAVQENLSRLGCTRIVVAHRLSTVRNADLILVLENGQIIERGNHESLLASNGLYARLVNVPEPDSDLC
jgi:ABC-type bacteriocin/lantibiotic exporter with double-glycine peptidase domain